MGVVTAEDYAAVFRKLFPPGEYWDRQFSDPASDVSLFGLAKLPEFIRFRKRMEALQTESRIAQADELISEWERVLLGSVFPGLGIIQRRLQLQSRWDIRLNRAALRYIATVYGLSIADVSFPCRPGFFGFSRFRTSGIGSPAVFSVIRIIVHQEDFRAKSWALITADYPAKQCGRIRCGIDRLTFFPVNRLKRYIDAKVKESCAGYLKCGGTRLFPRFTGFDGEEFARRIHFFPRFERVLINDMPRRQQPFKDFEKAITGILLVNHIPYFRYEGA
jgi:hypothetical protein